MLNPALRDSIVMVVGGMILLTSERVIRECVVVVYFGIQVNDPLIFIIPFSNLF